MGAVMSSDVSWPIVMDDARCDLFASPGQMTFGWVGVGAWGCCWKGEKGRKNPEEKEREVLEVLRQRSVVQRDTNRCSCSCKPMYTTTARLVPKYLSRAGGCYVWYALGLEAPRHAAHLWQGYGVPAVGIEWGRYQVEQVAEEEVGLDANFGPSEREGAGAKQV